MSASAYMQTHVGEAVAVVLLPKERKLIVAAVEQLMEREPWNKVRARHVLDVLDCAVDPAAGKALT